MGRKERKLETDTAWLDGYNEGPVDPIVAISCGHPEKWRVENKLINEYNCEVIHAGRDYGRGSREERVIFLRPSSEYVYENPSKAFGADLSRRIAKDWALRRQLSSLHGLTHVARGTWTALVGNEELKGDKVLRIQAEPRKLALKVAESLPLDVQLHPSIEKCTHVLHVVQWGDDTWLYAVVPKEDSFSAMPEVREDRVGGQSGVRSGFQPTTRSFYKLKETVEMAGIKFTGQEMYVDIGAALGGWTEFLAANIRKVVAIDPSPLDDHITALPNVTFFQKRVEDVSEDEWDSSMEGQKFDGVVCDMNADPRRVCETIQQFRPRLKSGAFLVLTVKNVLKTKMGRIKLGEAVDAMMAPYLRESKCVWLFSNSRYESTLYGWFNDSEAPLPDGDSSSRAVHRDTTSTTS
eukprot:Rmarinus@m.18162